MNAIYWGLTALCIMGHQEALDREEMVDYVMSCWDNEAGQFVPSPLFCSSLIPIQVALVHIQITTHTSFLH